MQSMAATFPITTTGRGRNKVESKDYDNLLYDLNACNSFNQNLIKGVAKEHFDLFDFVEYFEYFVVSKIHMQSCA
mgnify:CR=1 FL=1